ncbi:hypothetical protein PFISCL1PPCAC_1804, partial [Pristionchus fissidentatus]
SRRPRSSFPIYEDNPPEEPPRNDANSNESSTAAPRNQRHKLRDNTHQGRNNDNAIDGSRSSTSRTNTSNSRSSYSITDQRTHHPTSDPTDHEYSSYYRDDPEEIAILHDPRHPDYLVRENIMPVHLSPSAPPPPVQLPPLPSPGPQNPPRLRLGAYAHQSDTDTEGLIPQIVVVQPPQARQDASAADRPQLRQSPRHPRHSDRANPRQQRDSNREPRQQRDSQRQAREPARSPHRNSVRASPRQQNNSNRASPRQGRDSNREREQSRDSSGSRRSRVLVLDGDEKPARTKVLIKLKSLRLIVAGLDHEDDEVVVEMTVPTASLERKSGDPDQKTPSRKRRNKDRKGSRRDPPE